MDEDGLSIDTIDIPIWQCGLCFSRYYRSPSLSLYHSLSLSLPISHFSRRNSLFFQFILSYSLPFSLSLSLTLSLSLSLSISSCSLFLTLFEHKIYGIPQITRSRCHLSPAQYSLSSPGSVGVSLSSAPSLSLSRSLEGNRKYSRHKKKLGTKLR